MRIVYNVGSRYVTGNGNMYVVVGSHGRLLITRDYNKAIACCNGEL